MAMLKNQRVYKNLCLLTLTCQAATIDIDIYIYIYRSFPEESHGFPCRSYTRDGSIDQRSSHGLNLEDITDITKNHGTFNYDPIGLSWFVLEAEISGKIAEIGNRINQNGHRLSSQRTKPPLSSRIS